MTTSASKAPWHVAVGCYLAGGAVTVGLTLFGAAVEQVAGLGVLGVQAILAVIALVTVTVATRLPRRARAMFVAGALTPIALAALAVFLLLWSIAHGNFTF